ncbi:MAG: tape measure protein, partial [Candidatus Marinimicrobia bacterium]|nr:tape measure protein [Candidatus Neomarinimicrobiota bacterium]
MALNLGELYLNAEANFNPVYKETKKLTNEINKTENTINKFSAATIAGMAAVATVFVAAGTKSIKLAANLEQSKIAFNTMLGSSEKAEKMLKKLYDFAAKTPFEFPEINTAAKSLLAFGTAAEEIPETLKMVGDISSGVGAGLNEIASIYGKIKVQGRLFAEDINQLTGRGIPVIQELAKQFNTTESNVKKLVEAGKIGFPQIQEAFKSLTAEGGKFHDMMAAQSESLTGLWSTFKDNINMAMAEIGKNIIETFDLKNKLKGAIDAIGNLTNWFINLPEPIKQASIVFAGLTTVSIGLAVAISGVAAALTALNLSFAPFLIGSAIIAGLTMIVSAFQKMAENAKLANMQVMQIEDVNTALKKRNLIEQEIARMEEKQKAAKGGDTKGGWLAGGIGSFTADDERTLSNLRYQRGEINAQIEKLKKLSVEQPIEQQKKPLYKPPSSISTAFDLAKFISESQTKMGNVNKIAGFGLPIDMYDPLREKYQLIEQTIQTLVANGIDPTKTALGDLVTQLNDSAMAIINRNQAENEANAAIDAQIDANQQGTKNTINFSKQLSQVSEIFSGFSGSLAEFGQATVNLISTLAAASQTVSKISFTKSEANPLGAIGGVLQSISLISGIVGAVQSFFSLFDTSRSAAEAQQRAAEEWRAFLQEASTSELM